MTFRFLLIVSIVLFSFSLYGQGYLSVDANFTRFPVKPNIDPNANDPEIFRAASSGATLSYTQIIQNKHAFTLTIGSEANTRATVRSTDYRWPSELESGNYVQDTSLFHSYFYNQRINYLSAGIFYSYLPFKSFENISFKGGGTLYYKYKSNAYEYFYDGVYGLGPGTGFMPVGELENFNYVVPVLYLGAHYNYSFIKTEKRPIVGNLGFNFDFGINYYPSNLRSDSDNDNTLLMKAGIGISYRI